LKSDGKFRGKEGVGATNCGFKKKRTVEQGGLKNRQLKWGKHPKKEKSQRHAQRKKKKERESHLGVILIQGKDCEKQQSKGASKTQVLGGAKKGLTIVVMDRGGKIEPNGRPWRSQVKGVVEEGKKGGWFQLATC